MLANKDIKIAWFLDNVIARMLQLVKDLPGSTSMLRCALVIRNLALGDGNPNDYYVLHEWF